MSIEQQLQDQFNLNTSSTLHTQNNSEQSTHPSIIQFEKLFTSTSNEEGEYQESQSNISEEDESLTQRKQKHKFSQIQESQVKGSMEFTQIQINEGDQISNYIIRYHIDSLMEQHKYQKIEISKDTVLKKDTKKYYEQFKIRQSELSPFKYKKQIEQTSFFQKQELIKLKQIKPMHISNIINFLKTKSCCVTRYLTSGGEADILSGIYTNSEKEDIECVFRIISYDKHEKNLIEEIEILNLLKQSSNTIKLLDHFYMEDIKIVIFVIQMCRYSLKVEMEMLEKDKKNYTYDQLCHIISNLIEGVIELRMYKIIHSDIKPDNILKTFDNTYVYSDFGISCSCQDGKVILPKGYSKNYCAPEQMQGMIEITYQSDVYSLGKIIQSLITFCLKQQQFSTANQFTTEQKDKLQELLNLINQKMVIDNSSKREKCIELIFQYYEIIGKDNIFMQNYFKQKIRLFPFIQDLENKDTKFMNIVLLKYQLLKLQIMIHQHGLEFKVQELFTKNQDKCQIILQSKIDVLKYLRLITIVSNLYFKAGQSSTSSKFREHSQALLSMLTYQSQNQNNYIISQITFNIGQLCIVQRQEEAALQYFLQSLQILDFNFKSNPPMKAQVYLQLGYSYLLKVETGLSYKNYKESFKIYKYLYQGDHKDKAHILDQLALYYVRTGDYQKGLKCSLKSYQMRKNIYKEEIHVDLSYSLSRISYCYQYITDYNNALKFLEDCLKIRKQLFDENSSTIGQTLILKGNILMDLNQYSEAIKEYMSCIKIYCISYENQKNLSIATTLNFISLYYLAIADFKKAKFCQNYSIWMKTQLYDNLNHPFIATSIQNKGDLYFLYGNINRGFYYILFSYLLNKNCKDQNTIALSKYRLGKSYLQLGQPLKGLKYSQKSLEIYQSLYPKYQDHLDYAKCLITIGLCYLLLGQFQDALTYCKRSFVMYQDLIKKFRSSKLIIPCLESLGDCYLALHDNQTAYQFYFESLEIRKDLYPKDHPEIAQAQYKLGYYYEVIGDYKSSLEFYLSSFHIRKNYKFSKNFYLKRVIMKIIASYKMMLEQQQQQQQLGLQLQIK